jgi:hypothetical protein
MFRPPLVAAGVLKKQAVKQAQVVSAKGGKKKVQDQKVVKVHKGSALDKAAKTNKKSSSSSLKFINLLH